MLCSLRIQALVLDATSRGVTCNLKKLEKVFHSKVSFNLKPLFLFIKYYDLLALFLGTVLFQALSFLGIISEHYAFSSVMVSQSCFQALCFLKHHGFLTLFLGIMFSQALFLGTMYFQVLWFLNVVCGQCAFSSTMVFQRFFWALCFFKHLGFSILFF